MITRKGAEKVEAERAEANRNLLYLHGDKRLSPVEALQLDMHLNDVMIEVWSSANPGETINRILNEGPKRGRPRESASGDFKVAADVAYYRRSKYMTRDAACEEVAKQACLSKDSVLRIYKRTKRTQGLLLNVAERLLCEQRAQGDDFP